MKTKIVKHKLGLFVIATFVIVHGDLTAMKPDQEVELLAVGNHGTPDTGHGDVGVDGKVVFSTESGSEQEAKAARRLQGMLNFYQSIDNGDLRLFSRYIQANYGEDKYFDPLIHDKIREIKSSPFWYVFNKILAGTTSRRSLSAWYDMLKILVFGPSDKRYPEQVKLTLLNDKSPLYYARLTKNKDLEDYLIRTKICHITEVTA